MIGVAMSVMASTVLAQGPVALAAPEPGLEVCYIGGFIRHIDEMVRQEDRKQCEPGPVLPQLDYSTGTGNVLTSQDHDGVMARISGFIHLEQAGSYTFAFESNDGVRLEIDGAMILEDPDVHSDQFSDYGYLEVTEPGWYPLLIRYFERKNTSTLKFHWQPPGTEGTMPLVPAVALAHGS
ncbi:hypothetical protein GCM10011348_34400 [Marinobacterium nitratireducens]|uniref:PA14 domain-containing protein n=2 Tax=Marinobacterium nitratireducens TaxID=518897 RepID=A0A917ZLJ8_9GAMM|nr:hypothetical protein GCM10011348_34400 [Marinobacterium nitratireducens]